MGPPPLKDDLYYDVEKNQFVKITPKNPAVDSFPTQDEPQETTPQEPGTLQEESKEQKNIVEFLYDIFQGQGEEAPQPENNEPEPLP